MSSRTLHVYGSTLLHSEYCPDCQNDSFIVGGAFVCCGRKPPPKEWSRLKVEVDPSHKRRKQPGQAEKRSILREQNNCCYYCGDEFGSWRHIRGVPRRVNVEWDHVLPFSYNGNNAEFVAACHECNQSKNTRIFSDMEEAKQYLQLRMHEKKTRQPS